MGNSITLNKAQAIALEIKLASVFNALNAGNFKEASARLVHVFEQAQDESRTGPTTRFDMEDVVLASVRHMAQKDPDAGLNLLTQIIQKSQGFLNAQISDMFGELLLSERTSTDAKINGFIIGSGLIDQDKHLQAIKMATSILEDLPLSKKTVTLAKKILTDTRDYWDADSPEHDEFSPFMDKAVATIKAGMNHLSPADAYEQIDQLFYQHQDLIETRELTFKRLEDATTPRLSADAFVSKLG